MIFFSLVSISEDAKILGMPERSPFSATGSDGGSAGFMVRSQPIANRSGSGDRGSKCSFSCRYI
jgi:hypothetical protein